MALVAFCMADAAYAQPAARRREQQKKTSNTENITTRARISYPTAAKMSEDVV